MKYNRTYHFSFTLSKTSDDKILTPKEELLFINKEVFTSEKLDGGNSCMSDKIFARSHSSELVHPSFSKLKQLHNNILYSKDFDFKRYLIFGENMQALHSIAYTKLTTCFYVFKIYDQYQKIWLSLQDTEDIVKYLGLQMVPIIDKRIFKSVKELRDFLLSKMKEPSVLGPTVEGFVVSSTQSFKNEDFKQNVAKIVREGHVQTDEHWSKNWKEQKIIEEV